ncbi:hypothetical protein POPTR_013G092250v4 [Populus trichocarpa]|uniref:Uncharacterized protein n=1 Tax=Populus trichocarpa TaxID=3694 RepID=A0ACC0S2A7_POPTR|nr:hypothetical protein POPTR_013G092250v4 [Populus trichocarpa]
MDTAASQSPSSPSIMFYDFLYKMRNPASLNLVKSIKSFIVSFLFSYASPENNSKKVQEFFWTMEAAIIEHPVDENNTLSFPYLSVVCPPKLLLIQAYNPCHLLVSMMDCVPLLLEALSQLKFIEVIDLEIDQEISEMIHFLQSFLRSEHLDIPAFLQNEASWLLAEKELQKINAFEAREKLLCIMSCCMIINNLLLNSTM